MNKFCWHRFSCLFLCSITPSSENWDDFISFFPVIFNYRFFS
jgi:hypothetical protein